MFDSNIALDVLITEVLLIFQWFNPFAWIIKKIIKRASRISGR